MYTKKARNLNENSTSPIFFATAKHESRDVEINTQRERVSIWKCSTGKEIYRASVKRHPSLSYCCQAACLFEEKGMGSRAKSASEK